jgi:NAD(P)-dependent dehydrogenase (short-subunit alcohol dehydrogenase family)
MDASLCTLITGASSGIGRAVAVRLSGERSLILHGRDARRLDETLSMCANPESHTAWRLDFSRVDQVAGSLSDLLESRDRAVESFVHCAGTTTVLPARRVDHHVAQESLNVNYISAVEIINVLLRRKINDHRLANIVFISSIWSRFGARAHSAYCASKGALDGFMRALAVELAPGIRVNSILPGAIQTPMAAEAFADPSIMEQLNRDYPMGLGEPANIADAVEFVLSARARWLTGQQIIIDGGRTVNMSLK